MAKDTQPRPTLQMIGVDIGDRLSHYCGLGADGTVLEEERIATTPEALTERFADEAATAIILEVGTHSPWVSRLLTELGHRVIVANPSRVRLIAAGPRKQDRSDAQTLARLGRIDPALLAPIQHHGLKKDETQAIRAPIVIADGSLPERPMPWA